MKINQLFPEGLVREERDMELTSEYLELTLNGSYLYLPKESLSERELLLSGLSTEVLEIAEQAEKNVWQTYLVQRKGHAPQLFDKVQFIYVDHLLPLSKDLKDFFASLLVNLEAIVEVSSTRTVLLLNQDMSFDAQDLIKDILPTIENDFDMKLTIFFGNSWAKLKDDELPAYFDSENRLFSDVINYKAVDNTFAFSQVLLWGMARQSDLTLVKNKMLSYINDTKDIRDIVIAMWEEHGNLVQTAQKLFIHRNSLQYKLDKFLALSGLNLKKLDDLAFCYLLILTE